MSAGQILAFGLLGLSYIAIYLGVGLLVTRVLRTFMHVEVMLTLLIQFLLVLVGIFVPWVVQSIALRNADYEDFTLVRVPDPICSLVHLMDTGGGLPPEGFLLLVVVPLLALIVFVLNLPAVAREVQQVRIAKPARVAEEDAELAALKAPTGPVRTSPWD
jgi:hypothetical protein